MNIAELGSLTREELVARAKTLGVSGVSTLKKQDLVFRLLQVQSEKQGNIFSGGVIDIVDDGYGFLRGESLLPSNTDVYVSQSQVRRFGLRTGDYVTGQVREPKEGEKYYGLLRVELVNGMDPEDAQKRPHFENLTAVFPYERFKLEIDDPAELSGRLLDLIAPVGRGTARVDRLATESREDVSAEVDRERHHRQPQRRPRHGAIDSVNGRKRSRTCAARFAAKFSPLPLTIQWRITLAWRRWHWNAPSG